MQMCLISNPSSPISLTWINCSYAKLKLPISSFQLDTGTGLLGGFLVILPPFLAYATTTVIFPARFHYFTINIKIQKLYPTLSKFLNTSRWE